MLSREIEAAITVAEVEKIKEFLESKENHLIKSLDSGSNDKNIFIEEEINSIRRSLGRANLRLDRINDEI